MRSTVKIPTDKRNRHIMTIPIEIWNGESLQEGDLIEVDIRRIERPAKVTA